jgi:hypothetical protein
VNPDLKSFSLLGHKARRQGGRCAWLKPGQGLSDIQRLPLEFLQGKVRRVVANDYFSTTCDDRLGTALLALATITNHDITWCEAKVLECLSSLVIGHFNLNQLQTDQLHHHVQTMSRSVLTWRGDTGRINYQQPQTRRNLRQRLLMEQAWQDRLQPRLASLQPPVDRLITQLFDRWIDQDQIGCDLTFDQIETGKKHDHTKQLRRSFDLPCTGEGFKLDRQVLQLGRQILQQFSKDGIWVRGWNDHDG